MILRHPLKGIRLFRPKKILLLLLLFLIAFPKGGVKLGGTPITWGYLFLGLTTLFTLTHSANSVLLPRFIAFLALLPFQLVSAITLFCNPIKDRGFAVAFLISFFFIPTAFFVLLSRKIEQLDLPYFFRLYRNCIRFIALYGIFLFFIKIGTGKFLEIPCLTINLGDLGGLENKHNNRGFVYKLISTYNNGNLYGIALLILLPLYAAIEKERRYLYLVKLSLLFTFSRTVWFGLAFYEILSQASLKKKFLLKMAGALSVLALFIGTFAMKLGLAASFFFDRNLGGRSTQLKVLSKQGLFSSETFQNIPEIIYLGVIEMFGFAGLVTFLIAMLTPLLIARLRFASFCPVRKGIFYGLLNYLFVGFSDGALLFIPVLTFYWFLSSLLLKRDLHVKPFYISEPAPPLTNRSSSF